MSCTWRSCLVRSPTDSPESVAEVPINDVVHPDRLTFTETKVSVPTQNLASALRRAVHKDK